MPPRLSIVIPVWNDSAALQACLERLRSLDAPPAEIIVCDASSDPVESTRSRNFARLHHAIHLPAPRPSRGAQLAAGAAAATGSVIVFSHADTHLSASHLHTLLDRLDHDPDLLAGAFHRDVASLYPALAWATPAIHWYMEELGPLYGDQSPFIRRQTLDQLGGYPDLPLMEDLTFSDRLRHHLSRHQLTLLLPPLPTSPRRFLRYGRLRTKLTNLALTAAWRLGLASPAQLHRLYYPTHQNTPPPP
jgi:glycosyltransferase involved in cell wall biosynthesis